MTSSVIIHLPFYAQVSPIYFGSWFPLLVSEIYGGIFYNLGLVPYNAYLGEIAKDGCEVDTPEWKARMGEISSKVIGAMCKYYPTPCTVGVSL